VEIDASQASRAASRFLPFLALLLLSSLIEHVSGWLVVLAMSTLLVRLQTLIDSEYKRLVRTCALMNAACAIGFDPSDLDIE
jgi:hypothetical protein